MVRVGMGVALGQHEQTWQVKAYSRAVKDSNTAKALVYVQASQGICSLSWWVAFLYGMFFESWEIKMNIAGPCLDILIV